MHIIVQLGNMKLKNDWQEILNEEIHQPYFNRLMDFVHREYDLFDCYPKMDHIWRALDLTSYQNTKVLILGQDPYHEPHQAMGLAFSVPVGVKLPPSLRNIYKELVHDLDCQMPADGDLTSWASQGVLLLNAILTVRSHEPLSHQKQGWERFTDSIIMHLNQKEQPVVFVLWGSYAKKKKSLITNPKHLVIENVHPSPLSAYRGFFGSKPFSRINDFLTNHNVSPIDFTNEVEHEE